MRSKVTHHRRKGLEKIVRIVEFAAGGIGPHTDVSSLARHPIEGMPQMVRPVQGHHPDGTFAELGQRVRAWEDRQQTLFGVRIELSLR